MASLGVAHRRTVVKKGARNKKTKKEIITMKLVRDCLFIIKGIFLLPYYLLRNYLRDRAIYKINSEREKRGEEPLKF